MLEIEEFKKGIDRLMTEYKDKGFTMSQEKAAQWYKYLNRLDSETYEYAISKCLESCNFIPSMADILKHSRDRGNYIIV